VTTSQKAALSLLISVVLFGAFTALTFTGLFDLIEARFYNPSIANSLTREITRNADAIDDFLTELQTRFSGTLKDSGIRHSFLPNQSAEDISERSRVYGLLIESIGGLQWVRFIDSAGTRIHYSTYGPDIAQQDRQSVSYRGYAEPDMPYEKIAVNDGGAPKYTFDETGDRILFSFPFYDSFEVYRGTAVFSVSIRAVAEKLISDGRIKVGQDLSVISNPPGLLSGVSTAIEKVLTPEVSSIWLEGGVKVARLVSPDSNVSLALISVKTSHGFYVGRLVDEVLFSFPLTMKIILLASFFLTVYLTIFLLFNLRQDSVTIVQNRLKQLQISLIEQYYERKSDVDWSRWSRELEQRRDEISAELKQGIKTSSPGKNNDIDVLIDKSWDELLSVIGGRKETGIDEVKLETILNRVLAALPAAAAVPITPEEQPAQAVQKQAEDTLEESGEAEVVEELTEEAEAAEVIEEIQPLEEAFIETKAENEQVEAVKAPDSDEVSASSEEAVGELEELEELAELDDAEEALELESAEAPEEPAPDRAPEDMEVPVIDIADLDLTENQADAVVSAFDSAEEIEELEELGDAEEVAENREKVQAEVASEEPVSEHTDSKTTIEKLASQIEFSPIPEPENTEDVIFHEDFEVVSPFSSMLFDFSDFEDQESPPSGQVKENTAKEESIRENDEDIEFLDVADTEETREESQVPDELTEITLEEDKNINKRLFMISKSFLDVAGNSDIETLEALPGEIETLEALPDDVDEIITEKEGIPYISKEALSSDSEQDVSINKEFKNLVDSIIN